MGVEVWSTYVTRVRKGTEIKLHLFLNLPQFEKSRFSLYFFVWVASRRAYEHHYDLGLDTGSNYEMSVYTKLHGVTLQQTEHLLQYMVCAELYMLPAAVRCGGLRRRGERRNVRHYTDLAAAARHLNELPERRFLSSAPVGCCVICHRGSLEVGKTIPFVSSYSLVSALLLAKSGLCPQSLWTRFLSFCGAHNHFFLRNKRTDMIKK
jgi:hypothetical protein